MPDNVDPSQYKKLIPVQGCPSKTADSESECLQRACRVSQKKTPKINQTSTGKKVSPEALSSVFSLLVRCLANMYVLTAVGAIFNEQMVTESGSSNSACVWKVESCSWHKYSSKIFISRLISVNANFLVK